MNLLAQGVLLLWMPIVVFIFTAFPPRKAMLVSLVVAWLALPNGGWSLPGLPDYTKMVATMGGILLCALLFDMARLLAFQPRWFDIPVAVWCLCPFASAVVNDLGGYEGLSAVVDQTTRWGIPYFIGRIYINDLEGMRDLALAIVIGGLIYVPFCLVEIRLSPIFHRIYGGSSYEGMRYGGYRPIVLLANGLELGMWMTCTSFVCCQLWSGRSVKMLWGWPFGLLTLGLLVTTVLCKSTGALFLMSLGLTASWAARRMKRAWPVWLLIAIPVFYTTTRTFDLWSGRNLIEVMDATVGPERSSSLEFRMNMETKLARRALIRPIFGWGRFGRFQVTNADGKVETIPDGYWIIALGMTGLVGLSSFVAMHTLPMILTIRRFPARSWSDPQVAPAVAVGVLVVLIMIDFLSNAMPNPMYAVMMGGLTGQSAVRLGGRRRESEACLAAASGLMAEGRPWEAEPEFRRAIGFASDGDDIEGRRVQAEAFDGLGHSLLAIGHAEEAAHSFGDALVVRDWLAERVPDAGRFHDLAIAREGLARALAEAGRIARAIEERELALRIWDTLAADHPRDAHYRDRRVDAMNDLAWLLATEADPQLRDPERALRLAQEAVRTSGDQAACWNTLGVARYRAGDWAGAVEALERSALSGPGGVGTAFDHLFIAMAWSRLQNDDLAREWYERGLAWTARHRPDHPALRRFAEEAGSMLPREPDPAKIAIT